MSQVGARSQTSHSGKLSKSVFPKSFSVKKLTSPKFADQRQPQRFIYPQHTQQENKFEGKLPEIETKTVTADAETKNTVFTTEQRVASPQSPQHTEFQSPKPESRQYTSDVSI